MDELRHVVIAGPKRTPIGAFQGFFSSVSAPQLGATAIKASIDSANIPYEAVNEVIMGNVLTAGLGQAPARQAAIYSGLADSVECLTVNKMCGSGLKAVMLATQAIQVGDADVIVAGGMENMSRAPYLLPKARSGLRLGHGEIQDSMILDGLWDIYNDKHMGSCAEMCAKKYNFTREEQDLFARESYLRAQEAQKGGLFEREIIGVEVTDRKGNVNVIKEDEEPERANFEKMAELKPAFEERGTVTAANASKINDGAAAMVVLAEEKAKEFGIIPVVRIVCQSSIAQAPEWFTTAPIGAIQNILKKSNLSISDIELFEINEAFAVVAMAAIKELGLSHDRVNIHGGAVAMGHPIGASGARILVTLLHAMQFRGARRGIAALCIGGGEASAVLLERI